MLENESLLKLSLRFDDVDYEKINTIPNYLETETKTENIYFSDQSDEQNKKNRILYLQNLGATLTAIVNNKKKDTDTRSFIGVFRDIAVVLNERFTK